MDRPDRETIYRILQEVTQTQDHPLSPQTELLESNILDSLSFLLFLDRLDDSFGIEIQPTQVPTAVWKTPQSIADYITEETA